MQLPVCFIPSLMNFWSIKGLENLASSITEFMIQEQHFIWLHQRSSSKEWKAECGWNLGRWRFWSLPESRKDSVRTLHRRSQNLPDMKEKLRTEFSKGKNGLDFLQEGGKQTGREREGSKLALERKQTEMEKTERLSVRKMWMKDAPRA